MFAQRAHLSVTAPKIRLLRRLSAAIALHRQRQDMLKLDDHMLRDIGLTPAMVHAEAARPFWDAPDSWMQQRP
jgi:uncharacterized protein YjiS (DUF1127 family)